MRNLLKDCHFEVDQDEVFRAMGYPDRTRVSEPVLHVCRPQLDRLHALADPWGSYRELAIEKVGSDWVHLEHDRAFRSRRVARMLRRATSLEVCLVTLGAAIAAEIRRLTASGDMLEALVLDAAATAATHGLMGALRQRICTEAEAHNCGTTIPYGPGYTGWDIRDLPVLFSCLQNGSLPVRLNEQLVMIPEQSLLCVVGIVPGGPHARPDVWPCRLCDLAACSLRRVPYRPVV